MMPTAELLVMETTRSAACPKQLSTKRNRRKGKKLRARSEQTKYVHCHVKRMVKNKCGIDDRVRA